MPRSRSPAAEIPHTWDIEHWPDFVYPHTPQRARYLVRTYRDELTRDGVMARVGRELVFFGSRYARWLEKRAANVPGYVPAPNRPRPAAAA
jgi:hypothetical protein